MPLWPYLRLCLSAVQLQARGFFLRPGAYYAAGAFLFIQRQCSRVLPFPVYRSMAAYLRPCFLETTAKILYPFAGRQGNIDAPADMAQAFNPVGSLIGHGDSIVRGAPQPAFRCATVPETWCSTPLTLSEKAAIRTHDLAVIRDPYVAIGLVVLVMFVIIALVRCRAPTNAVKRLMQARHLRHLWHNHPAYR